MNALVQIIYNVVTENIPLSNEDEWKLAEANIPFKTKKQVLVQDGGGFIQELLTPFISSLEFLML